MKKRKKLSKTGIQLFLASNLREFQYIEFYEGGEGRGGGIENKIKQHNQLQVFIQT